MELPVEAVMAGAFALLGIVFGALISEIRTTRAEGRAERKQRQGAIAGRQLVRLRDTRIAVRRQIAELEAVALGDIDEARRHSRAIEDLDNDLTLVGDADAVRAFRDLVVELRTRFGKGLPPSYTMRMAKVLQAVMLALDEQDDRILNGKPIARVTREQVPELFAPETIAAQLRLPFRFPSFPAMLARTAVDLILWMDERWPTRHRRNRSKRRRD